MRWNFVIAASWGLLGLLGCEGSCSRSGTKQVADAAVTSLPSPAQDRIQAVQALLDSQWVQNALEPEGPNPPPLVVVAPHGLEGAAFKAFGQNVTLLSPEQVQAQRPEVFLELSAVLLEGDDARVTFRLDSEGVVGEAQLKRVEGKWQVARVTGTEH